MLSPIFQTLTAAAAAFLLSTLSIAAAIGPGAAGGSDFAALAASDVQAHG